MLPLFEALNDLAISVAIRESLWAVAVINTLHLLFLVVFAGAILIVDLRLLASATRGQPLADVARDAQPWVIIGLVGLTLTGIPQLLSNALREYYSYLFWTKMAVLVSALIFTFTLRRRVTLSDDGRFDPLTRVAVGLVSITLWLTVVVQARLIGLFT